MPTEDLPGLGDIESQVKSLHGFGGCWLWVFNSRRYFRCRCEAYDGSCIQVFLSGEGEEMGWLRIDEDEMDAKSGELQDIVSQADAEDAAVKALEDLDIKGDVMGVLVDVFANQDVYVVEVDTDEKSYDVFVSPEGKVLGFDEYEVENPFDYDLDEEDELKALRLNLRSSACTLVNSVRPWLSLATLCPMVLSRLLMLRIWITLSRLTVVPRIRLRLRSTS